MVSSKSSGVSSSSECRVSLAALLMRTVKPPTRSLALVTAARNPDRFTRLVLGDLAIDPADREAQKAGVAEAKRARARAGLAEIKRPEGIGDHADAEEATKAVAATQLHPDLAPFVDRLPMPTLIVTGEYDPNLPSSRRALGLLANGQLDIVEMAGHAALLQRPEAVLAAVLPFLAGGQEATPTRPSAPAAKS